MKISFICTVLNEEKTILQLLHSIESQSVLPDEVIIVDGGSSDNTLSIISNFKFQISKQKVKFIHTTKKGNRSVGRNEAVSRAKGDIIVCSDAGCILDREWVEQIVLPFTNSTVDVVGGYYKGMANSIFQQCLIPYALVMEDKVRADFFLPASRSLAFRKSIWKKAKGFPEAFSHNEDFVFAHSLKRIGAKIVFAKKAIVHWQPVATWRRAALMFFRFAYGDAEAGILRKKVLALFGRYFIGMTLVVIAIVTRSVTMGMIIMVLLIAYMLWAIIKNYKYVKRTKAVIILPSLQFLSDVTVISGSTLGFIHLLWGTQKKQ